MEYSKGRKTWDLELSKVIVSKYYGVSCILTGMRVTNSDVHLPALEKITQEMRGASLF